MITQLDCLIVLQCTLGRNTYDLGMPAYIPTDVNSLQASLHKFTVTKPLTFKNWGWIVSIKCYKVLTKKKEK